MKKSIVESLFEKIDANESGCWEWQGSIQPTGYGQVHFDGKTEYAHRVMWQLSHGAIPEGLDVCHSCDKRKCIKPSHLFLGTRLDNMKDAVAKDRHARGSKHGRSKLDEATVLAIRSTVGRHSQIAKQFGVSQATISMIKNRRIWQHT